MQFQSYDERKLQGVATLRRDDLRILAKQYGIAINPNGRRDRMLPIMQQAEADGVFQKPPPVIEPPKPIEYTAEHMGVKRKWAILADDVIVQSGIESKDKALEAIESLG